MALVSSQAIFWLWAMCSERIGTSQRGTEQALSAHGLECAVAGHYCTGLGNLQSRNPTEAGKAFEAALKLLTDNLFELQRGSEQLVNELRRTRYCPVLGWRHRGDQRHGKSLWPTPMRQATIIRLHSSPTL